MLGAATGVSNATWGQADVQVVGPSQFWVAGRHVPEPNTDTLKTAPVFQYLPQHFKDSTWTPEEIALLTDAILKAAQACLSRCLHDHHFKEQQQRSPPILPPMHAARDCLIGEKHSCCLTLCEHARFLRMHLSHDTASPQVVLHCEQLCVHSIVAA